MRLELDKQIATLIFKVGKRMRLIDDEWREKAHDVVADNFSQTLLLPLVEVSGRADAQFCFGEPLDDLLLIECLHPVDCGNHTLAQKCNGQCSIL